MLDRVPAIVYVARPDGRLTYANDAWSRMCALPESLDGTWIDVVHPDDFDAVATAWLAATTTAKPFHAEFRLRERDGDYRSVISHAEPMLDADGIPTAWYGVLTPVDEGRLAERALTSLSDALPQLVWANDAHLDVTYINAHWSEYTGLRLSDVRGHGWTAIIHPDDLDAVHAVWRSATDTGTFESIRPVRLRRHDGAFRWFVIRAVAVRDDNGAIARWYGTATDVDEEYRAVQRRAMLDRLGAAFAESLEFERTAQTVVSALCEDFADFAFVDVVNASGRLERIAVEAGRLTPAGAKPFKAFAPPPEARSHPINLVLVSGRSQVVPVCGEAWLRSTTWSEEHYAFASSLPIASIAYVPMIAAGERVGVLTLGAATGTGRSFTAADLGDAEEVAARAAIALANARLYRDLLASESRYRGIIDTAQEGVWITDADDRTRYVNARMTEMLGWDADAMYGRTPFEFMAPEAQEERRRSLREHRAGRGYRGETRLVRADGRIVAAMVASNALYDAAGMYSGSLGMFTDITERIAIESQYRILARASDVLSGSLDLEALLGRFADLLATELGGEATIALHAGRAVVRRADAHDAPAHEARVVLKHRDAVLGSVTIRRARAFGADEQTLLEELGARASVAIENAQLYQREHHVAVTLQRALLPAVLPTVDAVTFDAVYYPGATEAEIGGDWYDAIALPDERVLLSIGDVTGRGLRAAVIMGRMRQAIETLATYEADPVRLLDAADGVLRRAHPDAIVTALVALLDTRTGTLTYATAGHPPPFVRAPDGDVRQLPAHGLPLGLREGAQPAATTVELPAGSLLVFFTDGLVESTRDIAEGERRLIEALRDDSIALSGAAAASIAARVLDEGARDDVAVMTVRTAPPSPASAPWTYRWRFDPRDRTRAHDVRDTMLEAIVLAGAAVDVATVQLVFGELVGNAVRHAPGEIDLELGWDEAGDAVITVSDEGPGYDAPSALPPHDAESGRGLYLISALTRDFRVERRGERGASARAVLAARGA